MSSRLTLDNGLVTLNRLQGQSDVMAMTGEGQLDLQKENCDMRFNVRVLGGWKGEGKLIDRLKQIAIPLRIYGEWQSLSYSLQVDQILRKQLQDEAKQRLNDWVERVIKAAKTATMPKSCSISCNSYHRGPEVSGLCLSSKRNVTMMPGGGRARPGLDVRQYHPFASPLQCRPDKRSAIRQCGSYAWPGLDYTVGVIPPISSPSRRPDKRSAIRH